MPDDAPPPVTPRSAQPRWETVSIAVAAIVGLLSLAVSAYAAYTLHVQTRAQVFPFLQIVQQPTERKVAVFNKGTGPAFIRDVVIHVDGAPITGWSRYFEATGLKLHGTVAASTANGAAIAANETYPLLVFAEQADFDAYRAVDPKRYDAAICYCSVLDECWTLEVGANTPKVARAVRECRVDPATAFRD